MDDRDDAPNAPNYSRRHADNKPTSLALLYLVHIQHACEFSIFRVLVAAMPPLS